MPDFNAKAEAERSSRGDQAPVFRPSSRATQQTKELSDYNQFVKLLPASPLCLLVDAPALGLIGLVKLAHGKRLSGADAARRERESDDRRSRKCRCRMTSRELEIRVP
jgi:hypothetical protein